MYYIPFYVNYLSNKYMIDKVKLAKKNHIQVIWRITDT